MRSTKLHTKLAVLFAIGIGFFYGFSGVRFAGWEKLLKGPFSGHSVAKIEEVSIDSSIELPRKHLLFVSNSFTNSNGGEWPVLVLLDQEANVVWAQILQPIIKYPNDHRIEIPLVKNVVIQDAFSGGNQLKILFSCFWGAGGHENGLVYLNKKSLAFEGFAISW